MECTALYRASLVLIHPVANSEQTPDELQQKCQKNFSVTSWQVHD
jgi:hypothetical protein